MNSENGVNSELGTEPSDLFSVEHPRVTAMLADYQAQLDAGKQPDRNQLLSLFPEIQEELNDCLDALDFVVFAANSSSDHPADAFREPPRELGDYRLVREIGRGGMGIVYEAEQLSLPRNVAVKILPLASFLDGRQLQRFKNEAKAAALLQHPNIVRVHAVGCERSVHFYAMDLIDGHDLSAAIREIHGDPPVRPSTNASTNPAAALSTKRNDHRREFYRSVARLGQQAAEALHFAHEEGVIHRDVKPANLLLDKNGSVHVTDFGLARIRSQQDLTLTGDLIGTLRYMSPEQVEAHGDPDRRTDVYSLGLTIYELIAGHAAFRQISRQKLLNAITDSVPESLRSIVSDVPGDLQTIVEKAISKQPEDRYATAQELADDFERFLNDQAIVAKPPTGMTRFARFVRRNPVVTLLLAVSTLLFATVAAGSSFIAYRESQIADRQSKAAAQRELEVYARDMRLANIFVKERKLLECEQLLLGWVPPNAANDHRGIEWYHLWRRAHPTDFVRSISHPAWCNNAVFSPDGQLIADASVSRQIPIWDLSAPAQAEPVHVLDPESKDYLLTATFAEHNLLVAGDRYGRVHLWHWSNFETAFGPFKIDNGMPRAQVIQVDIDSDGKWLAAGIMAEQGNGHATVIELATGEVVFELPKLAGTASVGFVGDGRLLVASHLDSRLRCFDVETGELVATRELDGTPLGFDVSEDRQLIGLIVERDLGGVRAARAEVRRLDTWEEEFEFPVPRWRSARMAFSSDNRLFARGDGEGRLWIADLQSRRVVNRRLHGGGILSVHFSPDSQRVVTTGEDRMTHIVQTDWVEGSRGNSALKHVPKSPSQWIESAAYLNDDKVCIARNGYYLDIWSVTDGELLTTWELDPGVGNCLLVESNQQHNLLVAAQRYWPVPSDETIQSKVTVLDSTKGNVIFEAKVPSFIATRVPISPNGRFLAVPTRGKVVLFDLVNKSRRVLEIGWAKCVAFSPDSQTLAVPSSEDGTTHFIDVETLQPVREPLKADTFVDSLDYLPNGHLAVVGFDKRLKIWDTATGELVNQSAEHTTYLATLSVSPDGKRIATGSIDGKVRLFETESCQEVFSVNVPQTYPYCDFSTDGESLSIGAGDALILQGKGKESLGHLDVTKLTEIGCMNVSKPPPIR